MDGAETAVWFLGDLEDPWVQAILESIRSVTPVQAIPCAEDVPERPFSVESPPRVVVLHRSRLTQADAACLDRWKPPEAGAPRIILCHGPMVRYSELERCSRAVDLFLPEATADEILPRRLADLLGVVAPIRPTFVQRRPAVEVVSSEFALRAVLADACSSAGYSVSGRPWPPPERPSTEPVLIIWDVPVLEPGWPDELQALGRTGPVVALLGFPERQTVATAREHGAAACLEVPLDLDDLIHVLDRLAVRTGSAAVRCEEGHPVPPAPASRGARGRPAILDRPRPVEWASEAEASRMI